MCAFNSPAFPGSLALVTESSLIIGTIDEIQVCVVSCVRSDRARPPIVHTAPCLL